MPKTKVISIGSLLKKTLHLISKDHAILFPYLIISFLLMLQGNSLIEGKAIAAATPPSADLLLFYFLGWLYTLLAQSATILMAQQILKGLAPDLASSFTISLKRFPVLGLLSLLAFFLILTTGLVLALLLRSFFIYGAVPLIMFALVFFQLFPVIVLSEITSFWRYYALAFNFFRNNALNLLRLFVGISFISLLTVLGAALLDTAGIFGKAVLTPVLQGTSGALICVLSVIFFQEARSTISVNV